jgi:kynureninase
MAHRAPFAFEPGEIDYAPNAYRLLHGSPHIPALYSAMSGYEIVLEIGLDRIRQKSKRQTQRLVELADARGLRVTSPRDPERRGGTVTIDVDQGPAVVKELARREIVVDYRPGAGIRVSPHFYTTDEEVEHTVRQVAEIVQTKAYSQFLSTTGAAY